MENQIPKFSLEDEKLLLSEMEMLEVYGGTKARRASYNVTNGCKCKNCGDNSSSSGSQVLNCGDNSQVHAVACSGSSGSSGSSGGN